MTSICTTPVFCCLLWTLAAALIRPLPRPIKPTTTTPTDMTYWVSFSQTVRPGASLAVSVHVTCHVRPFTLRLDLTDYEGKELQDGQNFTLQGTEDAVETVQFEISSNLPRTWNMFLRARAWGGLQFDGFDRVTWDDKRLSIFIQTDKTTYQPGQTVRFRVLAMLPDLQVIRLPMDIVITDPNNNRIAQWTGVQSDDDTGVFQGEMVTSAYPPIGTWTLIATVDGVSELKTFKLQDYELPRFEVKVQFPSYALVKDDTLTGKITAKYTFGSPVSGSGIVVATAHYWRSIPVSLNKTFKLNNDGEGKVKFTTQELTKLGVDTYSYHNSFYKKEWYSLNYRTFNFDVTVTDDVTDDVMTATKSVRFYDWEMRLQFMDITPGAYKPGLPFNAYLEAVQPDGKRVANPETITVQFTVNRRSPFSADRETFHTETVPLDGNGVAVLKLRRIPENTTSLNIEAKSGKVETTKYLSLFTSPANAFLQLKLRTTVPKVGSKVKVVAVSNVKFGKLIYQIYSKGELVLAGKKYTSKLTRKKKFTFLMTSAIAPVAEVIAFFETVGGEIVVDRLAVGVDDVSNYEVSLKFASLEVKPGKNAKLKVRSAPRSTVFILGVDKSVKLLGTGNDITGDKVLSELAEYGSGNSFILRGLWYYHFRVTSAYDVFQGVGAGIITDGLIPGKNRKDVPIPFQPTRPAVQSSPARTEALTASTMVSTRTQFGSLATSPPAPAPSSEPAARARNKEAKLDRTPAERLRKFFPETWLWDTIRMKRENEIALNLTSPDTISTWVVSAFAVHPRWGLAVASAPAQLLTIKRLFVTLDLPHSAVRGEDVCFTALTFNRYPEPVQVFIILARNSSAFRNTLVICNDQNKTVEVRKSRRIKYDLGELKPNSMASSVFCINPQALGDMPVTVFLQADKPADGLIKTIKIKPEGVERSQGYPVLIEIGETGRFNRTVDIDLPEGFVSGSLRISVAVVGDVMGVVVDNLEDLLKMPYGCGEQNMVNFAPNTYIIAYLRKTNRLTPAILAKAKSFMLSGYQRQLQYQRTDGSSSAFGNSDKAGSIWLTAFVTKCFVQAAALGSDVITIEPDVVSRAVSWMTRYQNKDGSFREPGKVFHRAMQGGSAEGVSLAAYIVITLKEAENAFSEHLSPLVLSQMTSALSSAVSYLNGQLSNVGDDPYTICIVTYALTLAGSKKAEKAREKMEALAISGDTVKYWSGPLQTKQAYYLWYPQTDSLSIEMTSYALLTLMHDQSLDDAIPVFRWLNQQRGPKGGFISTQDTVLGLEALASMSDLALKDNFSPITVEISGYGQSSSLTIDKNSVMLLQKMELQLENDAYPDHLTITATSNVTERVFALAEVVITYNMDTSTAEQVFSAQLTVSNNTAKSFMLTTCVQRNSGNVSGSMIVVEIGIPSGYDVVKQMSDYGSSSEQEFQEEKVVLYYYSLDSKGDCTVLMMRMSKGAVAKSKPTSVKVYDYYKPDDEFTTSYSLKQYDVCDLEPDYMKCPSVNQHCQA